MNTLIIGELLRKRRLELGITQEQLCEGICEPPSLSKIENGRQQPSKVKLDALMERLGMSQNFFFSLVSKKEYEIYDLKYQIIQHNTKKEYDKAYELLSKFVELVEEEDKLNMQFVYRTRAVIAPYLKLEKEDVLENLYTAINLTHPKFNEKRLTNYLLSFEEIKIIINIATVKFELGKYIQSSHLLYELIDYLDERWIDIEEKARTYPLISYNLSKQLGIQKQYEQAITIAEKGIMCCREHGKTRLIGELMFNKSYCLCEMGEIDEGIRGMKQAYYTLMLMGENHSAMKLKEYVINRFDLVIE